jgi:membrane-bound metal-dependent hydrolase YbcI (DUF457 family)
MFMGVLAGLFTLRIFSPEAIVLLWVMTFLPDFDVFLEPFQRIRRSYFLSHKAASHSYIIGILFTGIVSSLVSIISNSSFFEVWFAGFIGYGIHVSLDFFTASKVPIFYPISKKEFRVIADRAINPLLALFSGINLLTLIVSFFTYPYYHFFMTLAYFYLYAYLIYFGIRIFLRILIQIKLPKNSHYIPSFIPFFYLIYESKSTSDMLTFKLSKGSAFSSEKKIILTNSIPKNSNEMNYYKKAKEISQEYRFFHKWDSVIPLIRETPDKVNIVLILCEGLSRKTSHFLSVFVDKKSNLVISKEEGFGPFRKWENPSF